MKILIFQGERNHLQGSHQQKEVRQEKEDTQISDYRVWTETSQDEEQICN